MLEFVPLSGGSVTLEDLNLAARIEPHGRGAVSGLIFHRNENGGRDPGELGPDAESDAYVPTALPGFALLGTELR